MENSIMITGFAADKAAGRKAFCTLQKAFHML